MKRLFNILVVALFAATFSSHATEAAHLNVIIILADDLGYGDLGCYGHPKFKTPNLDRMATEGARLTQFNCPMPYCAPTRASLMTGRYPFRCQLVHNPAPDGKPDDDKRGLPLSEVTLGQVFKSAGYATCAIGKWHLGHQPEYLPTRRGFNEYFGIPYSNDMRPVRIMTDETVFEEPAVQTTLTKRYTGHALAFIEKNKARPFFLYLPHAMPHKPLAASDEFYKKSGGGLYGDAIAELDWSVGQILTRLKTLGLDEKTIVFFTSDNGPWYGGSTGGLRGMKASSFEGGYRVPLIVRWPEKIPPGHVSHAPAVMMDIFATALKAAGIAPPANRVIDGKDIMPLFTSDAPSPHEFLIGMSGPRLASVRSGKWKLHVVAPQKAKTMKREEEWIDPRGPDGKTILAPVEQYHPADYPGLLTGDEPEPMMLFDLEADPGEQHNVAAQHADVVKKLVDYFYAMNKQVPASVKTVPQAKNGNVLLPARDVTIHGTTVRYEPLVNKNTVGYWTKLDDWVSWDFEVAQPSKFAVEILQGCGKGSGGAEVEFTVGEQTLKVTVEDTGHFQNFKQRNIGTITLDKPGHYTLSVKPKTKPGVAVMDLRQVILKPQGRHE